MSRPVTRRTTVVASEWNGYLLIRAWPNREYQSWEVAFPVTPYEAEALARDLLYVAQRVSDPRVVHPGDLGVEEIV